VFPRYCQYYGYPGGRTAGICFPVAVILTAALAGGIIGFIRYNFNPASIFMGDTGSMFIGYMLAAISIFGAVKSAATIALIVPAVALGLPIMDTAFCYLAPLYERPAYFPAGQRASASPAAGHGYEPASGGRHVCHQRHLSVAAVVLTEVDGYFAALVIAVIVTCVAIGAKKIGILNDR
jgi:UDP-GlcNAc:undecaprenyl-phosphate GlcNAc-1-phosphate transferase